MAWRGEIGGRIGAMLFSDFDAEVDDDYEGCQERDHAKENRQEEVDLVDHKLRHRNSLFTSR